MSAYIEVTISWLFKNFRGRDAKLFTTTPAFASHPIPTISVTSPDCGETGAQLGVEYTFDGAGKFPALKWQAPEEVKDAIKEWLLVTEDPDAPLPTPIAHGIYGGIPPIKNAVAAADFEIADESQALLKGGFHYGVTRRDFFFVVGLSENLDQRMLEAKATREQIAEAIQGKVVAWGQWFGSCERTWK
ncbi:hypothetical protein KJ359_001459 [Pestalotiopsis sp. 9143b]|nr:hypothetical protein KJ359_001459 [Pestalotiopsis sp. 9143b]